MVRLRSGAKTRESDPIPPKEEDDREKSKSKKPRVETEKADEEIKSKSSQDAAVVSVRTHRKASVDSITTTDAPTGKTQRKASTDSATAAEPPSVRTRRTASINSDADTDISAVRTRRTASIDSTTIKDAPTVKAARSDSISSGNAPTARTRRNASTNSTIVSRRPETSLENAAESLPGSRKKKHSTLAENGNMIEVESNGMADLVSSETDMNGHVHTTIIPPQDNESNKEQFLEQGRDVKTHRCTFVDFKPDGIETIATNGKLMALGRSSGSIEIWLREASGVHPLLTIPCSDKRILRSLIWKHDRLFGGNLDGSMFEVDVNFRQQVYFENEGGGGGIWGMDASQEFIATVAEDGKVRLYTLKALGHGLDLARTLSGSLTDRLLCVKFHPLMPGEYLYTGGMDQHIRKWSIKQKRVVDLIKIPVIGRSLAIWSLDMVGDVLACGDSLGRVHVWKGAETGTLTSFSEHRADVLSVKLSKDGMALFASGVDSRVAAFRFIQNKWVYVYSHRAHTHDVRTLGIVDEGPEELVCSGGVDAQLITYPVRSFERSRPRKNSPFPQEPRVFLSESKVNSKSRFMLVQHFDHLELWDVDLEMQSERFLLYLNFGEGSLIRDSAISNDGSYLAVIDERSGLYVYSVVTQPNDSSPDETVISLDRIDIESVEDVHVSTVAFCASRGVLAIGGKKGVSIIDLADGSNLKTIMTVSTPLSLKSSLDGQWMVVICLSGLAQPGDVHILNMDTLKAQTTLPKQLFSSVVAACDFTLDSSELVLATTDGSISGYSARDGFRESWKLTTSPHMVDRIVGITQNAAEMDAILVYSWSTIASVPRRSENPSFRFLRKFKPLIFASFCKVDELLVVEAPFVQTLKHLPDVVEKEKFGT